MIVSVLFKRISLLNLLILLLIVQGGCATTATAVKKEEFHLPENFSSAQYLSELEVTGGSLLELIEDEEARLLVHESIKNNRDIRAAAVRLKANGLLLARTSSAKLPEIDAGYSFGRSNQTADRSTEDNHKISMNLKWELDIWGGRLADEHRSATSEYEATAHDYKHAVDSLASRVIQSYVSIKSKRNLVELQQEKVKLYQKLEETMRRSFRNGQGGLEELSSAKARIESANMELSLAEQSYKEAVRELEILLGRYPEGGVVNFSSGLPQMKTPTATVPAVVLEKRPDIKAAKKRFEAADKSASAAGKARLPNIVLSAEVFRSNSQLNRLPSVGSSWGGLAAGILYPLFNGNRLKSEAKASSAEAEAAYFDFISVVMKAMQEVEVTFDREKYLTKQIQHLSEALINYQTGSNYYEKSYRQGGLRSITELYYAKDSELDTMTEILKMKTERIINRVEMAMALGTGYGHGE